MDTCSQEGNGVFMYAEIKTIIIESMKENLKTDVLNALQESDISLLAAKHYYGRTILEEEKLILFQKVTKDLIIKGILKDNQDVDINLPPKYYMDLNRL
jgi:hypothetical protein